MKEEMRQKFIEILGNNRVLFDEPMSQHTTFRIGGPADVFAMPENYEQIREVLRLCREEKLPFLFWETAAIFLSATADTEA